MSLRKSTIIIITLTLIGLLAILYGTSRHIILTNFIDLEKQVVEQNLERGQNALDNEIAKIDSFAHDWGAWDDTYEFVVDKNEEYIRSNLGDETFIDMPLNFLLFYDTSGALVWGGAFDLEEEKTMEVPGELMERLSLDSPFLRHPDVESMINGILLLPDGPLLVASRPILTSKNEGPIRGTLIMAHFLAPETIQELAEQTKLKLQFFRTDSPNLPRKAADAILDLKGPGQFLVRPAGSDTVNGFSLIRDIYNRPALVLKMDMPRDIYNQGVAALRHNLISLLAVGVIFGLVILFMMERRILSRIASLSGQVTRIKKHNGVFERISIAGSDELTKLSSDINEMLTEIEKAQKKLRESEEFSNNIIASITNGLFVLNKEFQYVLWNPAMEKISGIPKDKIIKIQNKKPWFFFPHLKDVGIDKLLQRAMEGETTLDQELPFSLPDGTSGFTSESYIPLKTFDGRIRGVIGVVRNITERKRAEEALVKAKEAALDANRAKSRFLATISHELRTPLNGIMGLLQLIETTPLNQEQKEYVEISLNSGRGLLTIINDILSISQVEAGKIEIAEREFNLSDIVFTVIETFKHQAAQKDIKVHCGIEENIPRTLVGDGGRIRQILFNLVGNSVKFTEQGEVRVEVSFLPAETNGDHVGLLFSVSDTGMGIPDDELKHVFDAFTQVDDSDTRRFQGTGLGLGIVKEFVGLMHGTIAVESEEGVGTTVYFTVKVKRSELLPKERRTQPKRRETSGPAAPPTARQPESLSERRATSGRRKTDMSFVPFNVLLAEDDPVSLISAVRMLEKLGHTVTAVKNGKEALAALEKDRFDVVLMDVQMPIMDGVEATEKIRGAKSASFNPNIPIVALTAYAMEGDKEKFIEAGMNLYIAKPVDMEKLSGVLARIIPRP